MLITNLENQYKNFEKKVGSYLSTEHFSVVKKAYNYALKAHGKQTRLTGDMYITHPLATSNNLADLHLDYQTLSAGLLHDVIEDCDVTYEDLLDEFGADIAKLVLGVTKLTEVENVSEIRWEENIQTHSLLEAQTLRKMLMTVAEDVRVVLIKLSDRLHNMETVDPLPVNRKIKFAKETMEIYAPLAHRLGMWDFKWRLEDLSFRILDPNMYKNIAKLINTKRKNRDNYIEKAAKVLEDKLKKENINAEIKGRSKHLFSTYRKILAYEKENKTIDEIYDLFAIRVVVQDVRDCYIALGSIHNLWPPLGGQFDDYIARPKDNMYRSIHTTVNGDGNFPIEIQIRTSEMDQYAEYGIAAHWKYKEGSNNDSTFDNKMIWLRQLLDWQRDVPGDQEFIDSFKTDIFNDQVYVFTPKGEIKELPIGSTPLDFAYRVHTDIGHSSIGARVNDKLVPLNTVLKNGDKVLIVTSSTEKEPSLDWLNPNLSYLITSSAKEKIRAWFRKSQYEENSQRGELIINEDLVKLGIDLQLSEIVKLTDYQSEETLLNDLGNGSLLINELIKHLDINDFNSEKSIKLPIIDRDLSEKKVFGVGDLSTRLAKCCVPKQGNEIIGYITRNRGVTIHEHNCINISNEKEIDRFISVSWGLNETLYSVKIYVEALDRVGLLKDITALLSDERVNIAGSLTENEDDNSYITLSIFIKSISQLHSIINKLENINSVLNVKRIN